MRHSPLGSRVNGVQIHQKAFRLRDTWSRGGLWSCVRGACLYENESRKLENTSEIPVVLFDCDGYILFHF